LLLARIKYFDLTRILFFLKNILKILTICVIFNPP